MPRLTVAELDDAIDALALGAESYTLPNGTSVKRTSLKDLRDLRADRKAQEDDSEGGIVAQYVEFR
jgi:hypothetical protein